MKTCQNCKFWHQKSDEIGKCENSKVSGQVIMMSVKLLTHFAAGQTEGAKIQTAQHIAQSLRFHKNFGCLNHVENEN